MRKSPASINASTVTQVDITGVEQPVMHACGHDVHVTSMVGTARRLVAMKESWSGTAMFVGQPAEERVGGVRAMTVAVLELLGDV